MTHSLNRQAGGQHERGFTLVELLTVIAIIGILIAILVPGISAIRGQVNKTATRATLSTLETGIETFRADSRIGGAYPPSGAPKTGPQRPGGGYVVANPYQGVNNGADIGISGGGILFWALAGADQLGCPGFEPTRPGITNWAKTSDSRPGGAYALDPNTRQPVVPRSGPFVDLAKVKISQFNAARGSWDIPAELDARQELNLQPVQREFPMFLDNFGQPILYWKADPAGVVLADDRAQTGADRGIYHFEDNAALVSGGQSLVLNKNRERHRLGDSSLASGGSNGFGGDNGPGNGINPFANYILNVQQLQSTGGTYNPENVIGPATGGAPGKYAPQNPDRFLLISAGPDGIFGSGDDIANFTPNGQ